MSETKRYRLPEQLGGAVWDSVDQDANYAHFELPGSARFGLPLHCLTEIPPPIPAEPEPGAYLIGGELAVRLADNGLWHTKDGTAYWQELWDSAVDDAHGADVDIVPLMALDSSWCECERWRNGSTFCPMHGTHKPVELPFRVDIVGSFGGAYITVDGYHPSRIRVDIGNRESARAVGVKPGQARELAAALLSAADRAEAGE